MSRSRSRSPPRRRARREWSRSPERERGRGRRRVRTSNVYFDEEMTCNLFMTALDGAAQRHSPPFNVSIVNDRMRNLDPNWDVSNSGYKRFADLCNFMHRKGVLDVARVKETICVVRLHMQQSRPILERLGRDDAREKRYDERERGSDRFRDNRDGDRERRGRRDGIRDEADERDGDDYDRRHRDDDRMLDDERDYDRRDKDRDSRDDDHRRGDGRMRDDDEHNEIRDGRDDPALDESHVGENRGAENRNDEAHGDAPGESRGVEDGRDEGRGDKEVRDEARGGEDNRDDDDAGLEHPDFVPMSKTDMMKVELSVTNDKMGDGKAVESENALNHVNDVKVEMQSEVIVHENKVERVDTQPATDNAIAAEPSRGEQDNEPTAPRIVVGIPAKAPQPVKIENGIADLLHTGSEPETKGKQAAEVSNGVVAKLEAAAEAEASESIKQESMQVKVNEAQKASE